MHLLHRLNSSRARIAGLALLTVLLAGCAGGGGSSPDVPQVRSIPSGVLLYTTENPAGGSTLSYLNPTTGQSVPVGSFAANVRVFGTNATGTRLLIARPIGGDPARLGAFITRLDGTGATRLGDDVFSGVNDGAITSNNQVLVVPTDKAPRSYGVNGAFIEKVGLGEPVLVSGAVSASGQQAVLTDDQGIHTMSFPLFENVDQVKDDGAYTWVRWSPAGNRIVYALGGNIWTINADGSGDQKVIDNGSYPTFDGTGGRIFFSRPNDGIYVKDLATGAESRLLAISGAWNGRIVWH